LEALDKNALALHYKAKQVKSGDSSNEEGQAARHYWSEVFAPVQFQRERFGYPPNNLLNYGYAILRAAVARALVGSGLLPTLGIHHHNRYNAFCLADDVIEPFRPFVDLIVAKIVTQSENGDYTLTTEYKKLLLGVLTTDIELNGQRSPLMVGLSQTTTSLVRCYEGESKEILYPTFVL
jgi:CRISP-associated protein Cas1